MSPQWGDINAQIKQLSKAKAAEWESYKRQLLSAGRDDIVAAVEQLVDIGVRGGSYSQGTPAGARAREIGEEINRSGGFGMMQEVHKLFVLALFSKTEYEQAASLSRRLELAWHGIGSWLG
jgi:hypothetical protein